MVVESSWTVMNLHGQINAACESRPGHPQPCHWSVRIMLECGFHFKLAIKWISVLATLCLVLANPVTYNIGVMPNIVNPC